MDPEKENAVAPSGEDQGMKEDDQANQNLNDVTFQVMTNSIQPDQDDNPQKVGVNDEVVEKILGSDVSGAASKMKQDEQGEEIDSDE